jgi:hypothetical protein
MAGSLPGRGGPADARGQDAHGASAAPGIRVSLLTAAEWNRDYPIGTKVVVRLHNGKRLRTRTTSEAATWGNLDHVAVEAIQPGYVLLSWVRPFLSSSPPPPADRT